MSLDYSMSSAGILVRDRPGVNYIERHHLIISFLSVLGWWAGIRETIQNVHL